MTSPRFALPLRRALAFAAGAALLAASGGCGTMHGWFQKDSGSPATFGTSVNLPLGKTR